MSYEILSIDTGTKKHSKIEYYFSNESEYQFKEDNKKDINPMIDFLLERQISRESMIEYILNIQLNNYIAGYTQAKKEV